MQAVLSFALAWAQASVTSVLAGAALAAVLALVRKLRPGVASQRRVWLAAMLAAAGTFVLAQWPGTGPWRVLPAIEVAYPAAGMTAGVAPAHAGLARAGTASGAEPAANPVAGAVPEAEPRAGLRLASALARGGMAAWTQPWTQLRQAAAGMPAPSWLIAAALVWLLCYGAGLAAAVVRWRRGARALRDLLAHAAPLDLHARATHAGFAGAPAIHGLTVLETGARVPPMLAGLWRPVLLLPRHVRGFGERQQQLIVAHELAHWRRGDHLWLHMSLLLQTILWFNPALRTLAQGLAQAQELGCDRHVLAGQPASLRRDYAAALLAQLNVQGQYAGMAAAFGGSGAAALSERIRQMRLDDLGWSARLAGAGRAALGACCAAVLAGSVLLQPAFAWRPVSTASAANGVAEMSAAPLAAKAADTPAMAEAALPAWQAPLVYIKIASRYGPRIRPVPVAASFHHGVDFAAPRGTPLLAPAGGTVLELTDHYQGQEKFGKVIVVDHGNGLRSVYAHLDQWLVRPGEQVAAGQTIGKTGNTGKTTGPHLHFEVLRNGGHIDPLRLMAAPPAAAA